MAKETWKDEEMGLCVKEWMGRLLQGLMGGNGLVQGHWGAGKELLGTKGYWV